MVPLEFPGRMRIYCENCQKVTRHNGCKNCLRCREIVRRSSLWFAMIEMDERMKYVIAKGH